MSAGNFNGLIKLDDKIDNLLTGNVTVGTNASNTLTNNGNEIISGTLDVTGLSTFVNANVTGNELISGTLNVTGLTTLANANITGNVTIGTNTSNTLTNMGNETIAGDLTTRGSIKSGSIPISTYHVMTGDLVLSGGYDRLTIVHVIENTTGSSHNVSITGATISGSAAVAANNMAIFLITGVDTYTRMSS